MSLVADENAWGVSQPRILLSQAKHGVDNVAMPITTSEALQQAAKRGKWNVSWNFCPVRQISRRVSCQAAKLIVVKDMGRGFRTDELIRARKFIPFYSFFPLILDTIYFSEKLLIYL